MGYLHWTSHSPRMLLLLLVPIIVSVIGPALSALTPLLHMTNHCYKTIPVNDSLVLDLTDNLEADRVMVGHLACAVTLQAPPDARVYLHVLQLAISDHAQMPDRLHIYDVNSQGKIRRRLTPSTGLYGVLERPFLIYNTAGMIVPDFRSAGPRMRLDYQGKPTVIYRGFRVLITVFYTPQADGGCRSDTLHCPYAGTCVPFSTRCDGFPNCGLDDNSDEKKCRREYVVTNILDEYSTRTAVIAAVTGIVVFLGVAALVFVFVLKYTRKKYGRSTDQSVRYTSRGGGACHYKNEADLTRLYAPPSYEDVMQPPEGDRSSLSRPYHPHHPHHHHNHHHPHHHRHSGPPPAYSAVAALVHQGEDAGISSEEDGGHTRPATLWSASSTPPSPGTRHPPPRSQRHLPTTRTSGARGWEEEEQEEVRLHGTWPSDTDEEEEVRARRRKKGGKSKGKVKAGPKAESGTLTGQSGAESGREKGGVCSRRAGPCEGGTGETPSSPAADVSSSCPGPRCLGEDSSPSRPCRCPSGGSSDAHSDVPSLGGSGSGGGGGGVEVVSETESQRASSKRNSRTESNSPDTSCASSHTDSPAKHPPATATTTTTTTPSFTPTPTPTSLTANGVESKSKAADEQCNPLHPLHHSSLHPLSPSVIPLDKLSPSPSPSPSSPSSSEEEGGCVGVQGREAGQRTTAAREEDFVDLNPAKGGSGPRDCVLHA